MQHVFDQVVRDTVIILFYLNSVKLNSLHSQWDCKNRLLYIRHSIQLDILFTAFNQVS